MRNTSQPLIRTILLLLTKITLSHEEKKLQWIIKRAYRKNNNLVLGVNYSIIFSEYIHLSNRNLGTIIFLLYLLTQIQYFWEKGARYT